MSFKSISFLNDINLLGQSIALLPGEHDPFNLDVFEREKATVIGLSEEKYSTPFADGKTYQLPKNVRATVGNRKTTTHSLKVESGDELARELDAGASMSAGYCGFSASASSQYSYSNSLSNSKYYAVLSVDHTSFTLELKDHEAIDTMITPAFVEAVGRLPEWEAKDDIYEQYVRFFRHWGTHVIKSCTFGARYQLKVENSTLKSTSKTQFQAQVSAEYSGVGPIKGDASVKSTSDYNSYLKTRQFQSKVFGGSPSSNMILSNAPEDPEKYREAFNSWANSLNNAVANDVTSVRLDSIGNLLRNSSVKEHQEVSGKLVRALDYLASMRLVEGLLKFYIGPPALGSSICRLKVSEYPEERRAEGTTGSPGILVKGKVLDSSAKMTISLGTDAGFTIQFPVQLSVFNISASCLEASLYHSGVKNLSLDKEFQETFDAVFASQTPIRASLPISILAPPQPVLVELSIDTPNHSGSGTVDLSPRGPTLVTRYNTRFVLDSHSLFKPGFLGDPQDREQSQS